MSKAKRLIEIDESTRIDHYYLDENDQCYFFGEYTAGMGYSHSKTNQLISNLKKTMDKAHLLEWKYKQLAIVECAKLIRNSFLAGSGVTFVPVPPSKSKDNDLYDDRLLKILHLATESWPYRDIRELVIQTKSTDAVHLSSSDLNRPKPIDLQRIYVINKDCLLPEPSIIIIFDDVLTTGCHYKAMKEKLSTQFPKAQIVGLFIARRQLVSTE